MKTKEFQSIIDTYVSNEQLNVTEHNEIKAILQKCEGKQFNLKTFSKTVLGEYEFRSKHGMFYICGNVDHLIGYSNTIGVNPEAFDRFDNCSGSAAVERLQNIEKLRHDKKLFEVFNKIDKHFKGLQKCFGDIERLKFGSYHFAPYYAILNGISPNKEHVKITDFYFIRK